MKSFYSFLCLSLISIVAAAQVGINTPWIWTKGSQVVGDFGSYGTMGIEHPSNLPVCRSQASPFLGQDGSLWMFGGWGWSIPAPHIYFYSDLWKFNPVTNNWVWMKGSNVENDWGDYGVIGVPAASNRPGGRYGAASWTDLNGNFWLFGGDGFRYSNWSTLSDLWKFDVTTNNWVWVHGNDFTGFTGSTGTQGQPSPTNLPAGRYGAVTWTDSENNLWLFGGFSDNGIYQSVNDMWKYNISTNQWTWVRGAPYPGVETPNYGVLGVASPANIPPGRGGAVGWIGGDGQMYMYGGLRELGSNSRLSDLWRFSPATNQWTWLSGTSILNELPKYGTRGLGAVDNHPGGRDEAVGFTDRVGNFWLFGGTKAYTGNPYVLECYNDLWKYSPGNNEWTWVKGGAVNANGIYGTMGQPDTANNPGSRSGATGWADASGKFWLFAGFGMDGGGFQGELNDLWKIDGVSLVPLTILRFAGKKTTQGNLIEWQLTGSPGAENCYVERSEDGSNFSQVGSMYVGTASRYQFLDEASIHKTQGLYYRLKLWEPGSAPVYSRTVFLANAAEALSLYPNPANSMIWFTIAGSAGSESLTVRISDVAGKVVLQKTIAAAGQNTHSLVVHWLPPGSYYLTVISSGKTYSQQFQKN
jgi:hypothetical protein